MARFFLNAWWVIPAIVSTALLGARPVTAQTPVSSTSSVTFTASADHGAKNAQGQDLVTSYSLDSVVMSAGTSTPALTAGAIGFSKNIGKPAPGAGNNITVTVPEFGSVAYGAIYSLTVSAIGPGGTGKSPTSAPFVRPYPPTPAPAAPGMPVITP